MKSVGLVLLVLLFVSCHSAGKQHTPEDKFVWDVQYAGYDHSQADLMGEVTYEEFLNVFAHFPWVEQIEKANENTDKVSPTLTVVDHLKQKDFFIAMAGDRDFQEYYLGYIYLRDQKGFFGIGKSKPARWLEVYRTQDTRVVRELIREFFARDYPAFEARFRKLTFDNAMKPADLAK